MTYVTILVGNEISTSPRGIDCQNVSLELLSHSRTTIFKYTELFQLINDISMNFAILKSNFGEHIRGIDYSTVNILTYRTVERRHLGFDVVVIS